MEKFAGSKPFNVQLQHFGLKESSNRAISSLPDCVRALAREGDLLSKLDFTYGLSPSTTDEGYYVKMSAFPLNLLCSP